ncbi:P-loop containing nucleoside triphosphate hydrolase protein [Aspergillus alliaceus]|uniref:P-loop containing nucleoside triphosphate hydrolase protein n=1 Tax=Petromyces alliaceus TaxID=209559 RepID=UPI0012A69766|nr:P-loop containing nucleoside triphosphate hydrolase protein [Aspergillus alliaceus]KAB8239053.1 P-loop containing nucleoside triphosphate hydrolase protein [Aspergillus alliaceus]
MSLLKLGHDGDSVFDESAYAPIISSSALAQHLILAGKEAPKISQFGLLAGDPRLFFNITHPSSVFICGSQGSGKSHTLSCILESCLIPSHASKLPNPLTSVVFHYDTFVGDSAGSPCEAAFLSSHTDVEVRVLCSPTNINVIRKTYSSLNVMVKPLQLDQTDLNTKRMMDLMAIGQDDGSVPLYVHTVKRILREMRSAQQETQGCFDYRSFKDKVMDAGLTPGQMEPLKQRLDTLESFMPQHQVSQVRRSKKQGQLELQGSTWDPVPRSLTIVDLSCPCISPETACALFNICLSLFLEQDMSVGRVFVLDEAHKYMNSSSEARGFTETILSAVRLQRHLGVRTIISTQEPTVSTALLNLCSVTIVHRFTSPEWLRTLQKHLAAALVSPFSPKSSARSPLENSEDTYSDPGLDSMFDKIVRLRVGEALLFAPSAVVKVSKDDEGRVGFHWLGSEFLSIKIRARLTTDGGKSVLSA